MGSLVGRSLVIQQLIAAHRTLVDCGIPAVRLEVGLLEHVALRRMEGRKRLDPELKRKRTPERGRRG